MKTIRYQLKTSKCFTINYVSIGGHYSIFYTVTERTNRQQTKIQLRIARKSCRSRKANFATQKMFECAFFKNPKTWYVTSH